MAPVALITGVTGQDGSYLSELLLSKGYVVHGLKRRSSSFNTDRIEQIDLHPRDPEARLFLHYSDLSDAASLAGLLRDIRPDEVYNLGAQSHVRVSFDIPAYTADVTGMGALRLIDAVRSAQHTLPVLPGLVIRDVRIISAPAARDHAVSPPQSVCLRKGIRILGRRQLPRILGHVRQ